MPTYRYFWTDGNDTYYGYTYDTDGSQGLFEGYRHVVSDASGATSTFKVYAAEEGNIGGLAEDQAFHTSYYDGETGQTDTALYYSTLYGHAFGSGMLGSYDYADFGDGNHTGGLYGYYGTYEANDPDTGLTYLYSWTDGYDYYYGYTYDADGSQLLYDGYVYSEIDENGNRSTYTVYDTLSGNAYQLAADDDAFHEYYYDHETGQTDSDPYFSTLNGRAEGSGMLGSADRVDFGDGDYSGGYYGENGYFEADDGTSGATYLYYWTNAYDIYYGYTYDADGSQGLYDGYLYVTTDESGFSSYYYVYGTSDGDYYGLGEDDAAAHWWYYDYETAQTDDTPYATTTYGAAFGSGMKGSYDFADFDDGNYTGSIYGQNGYYEADDQDDGATYFYYWTNGFDIYYGYTFDADGNQGLYAGYRHDVDDENALPGYYYVYTSVEGNPYGLTLDDLAVHQSYYDYEADETDYTPYYSTTYGYAFGTGMLGSYDYVDFGAGDYSAGFYGSYGHYEADIAATYLYYWTDGYDIYYGYTYDADSSQGLSVGYTYQTTDENGVVGYFHVYGASAGDFYGLGQDDRAAHWYYYDYQTDQYDYDPYYTTTYGYAFGSGMLGSYDHVDFDDGDYAGGLYGSSGFYVADNDDPGTTYYYYWTNGYDYYYGYTFDADRSQGLSQDFTYSSTDEHGQASTYVVYQTAIGDAEGLEDDDAFAHEYYFDYELDRAEFDLITADVNGDPYGSGMLGSYGYADFNGDEAIGDNELYGDHGYQVADSVGGYTFHFTVRVGDDVYIGYTYDADGSQDLWTAYYDWRFSSLGPFYETVNDEGEDVSVTVWSYEVDNPQNLPFDDAVFFTYYKDGETGYVDETPYHSMTYGYAAGSGIFDAYDWVDFDDGDYTGGLFGTSDFVSADENSAGTTYYYYWTNGYDYYYGYTYDADGSQQLTDDFFYSAYDENGLASTYQVYRAETGNVEELEDDGFVHEYYYDYELDRIEYDLITIDTDGTPYGSGMLASYGFADFDGDGEGIGDYDTNEQYGNHGTYEADAESGTYYFWAYIGGDVYYGVTYDADNSQDLLDAYYNFRYYPYENALETTNENGDDVIFRVYGYRDGNYEDLPFDDAVLIYWYTDSETGLTDENPYHSSTFGYAAGSGMLNAYDWVDLDDGDYTGGLFGSSAFEEAD